SAAPDLARYRLGPIRRRVRKRMTLAGDADYAAYRARLERDPAERAALADMLLITITEFFRDPEAWDAMRREVVPALAARAREGHEVRVWCAGCGTGEEAYSVAL